MEKNVKLSVSHLNSQCVRLSCIYGRKSRGEEHYKQRADGKGVTTPSKQPWCRDKNLKCNQLVFNRCWWMKIQAKLQTNVQLNASCSSWSVCAGDTKARFTILCRSYGKDPMPSLSIRRLQWKRFRLTPQGFLRWMWNRSNRVPQTLLHSWNFRKKMKINLKATIIKTGRNKHRNVHKKASNWCLYAFKMDVGRCKS